MPSKTPKQKSFMAAVANNPKFAKKVGVSSKVGKEFEMKDKKMGMKKMADKAGRAMTKKSPDTMGRAMTKAKMPKMAMGGIGRHLPSMDPVRRPPSMDPAKGPGRVVRGIETGGARRGGYAKGGKMKGC
jgi:hypothetical protein